MSSVDDSTQREIGKIVERILRDSDLRNPPIRFIDILEYLKVHRDFYSLEDPKFLQRLAHRIQIGAKKIVDVVRDKIHLAALWLPTERRILVDDSQPEPKRVWASFHDTIHAVLPWHRDFFLGDTAQTLEPDYQDMLESEANYGSSALMFGGQLFTAQALDTAPCWEAIRQLQEVHQKSLVTTFRRYIEHGHDKALAGLISTPLWMPKPEDQITRCRHFVRSGRFEREFPSVSPDELLQVVNRFARPRRGGIVGDFTLSLRNAAEELSEFFAESFFNQHYLLTLFVARGTGAGEKIFV
jgi:hypothetical protein